MAVETLSRLPSGFHVDKQDAADTFGLTPEEVKEERRARGERESKRGGRREYRINNEIVTGRGGFRPPTVKNPFDEILRTLGLLERVQMVCQEHGVATHEIGTDCKSQRLVAARRRVYLMLRDIGWSNVDIGKLFDKHPSTVLSALEGRRAATSPDVSKD